MSASLTSFQSQGSLLSRSHFLDPNALNLFPDKRSLNISKKLTYSTLKPCAKLNLSEFMGGRGICNGEKGIQEELKKNVQIQPQQETKEQQKNSKISEAPTPTNLPEDAFDKELMGLTGGFPGGEKGLKKFIQENPPKKEHVEENTIDLTSSKKPKPPELPLLMPGMIAIVKNPNNPFYMYCGIIQRITDGKAGVLFEGGNWDRLITFRLEELERREKGPPMKNPKSAILEQYLKKKA